MNEAKVLHFWMTRPDGSGDALSLACAAKGIDVVQLPLMDIVPFEDDGLAARQIMDLDHYSHIIFISTNAVRFGMPLIEQYWPQLPVGIHWLAIGEATANALSGYDIDASIADVGMDSEALLLLDTLQTAAGGRRALIMRGQGGREHLAQVLRHRGWGVDYCELYQRQVPVYPQGTLAHLLDELGVNCWLASSAETLQNGLALASQEGRDELLQLPVVVPSERVADIALQLGCQRVVRASNAGSEAVVAALLTLKD